MTNTTKYNHWYFRHPAHEQIAQDRYFLKSEDGALLEHDIDQVFKRVVQHLTGVDPTAIGLGEQNQWATEIYTQLKAKRLMAGGRILAQAGTRATNLNNCFVLGFEDNRETIMKVQQQHFQIQSQGGGTGFNISKLRPRWAWVRGNQARSCGSIGFTTGFSYWSSLISQGGNRSGANLAMLEDSHPDLLDFIDWKSTHTWLQQIQQFAQITDPDGFGLFEWQNPYQWQQFNVSVGVSDKFMKLLKENPDAEWQLNWKGEPWKVWKFLAYGREFEVTAIDEETATGKALSQLPFFNKSADFKLLKGGYNLTVKQIWQRIAKNAHEDGCPGILFIDRIRKFHNGEYFSPIEATNPCGEQPLPVNSVCCLGATNIYYCMTEDGKVNAEAFKDAIWAGVLMLNFVTDVTKLGIAEIDDNVLKERRIGLGCTGWHDALIKAKLKYSSEEGRAFVKKWVKFLRDESYRASIALAKHYGPFPAYDFKGYSQSAFFKTLPKDIQTDIEKYGIRNVTVNTIAPYGTTGTIMGTSTGCEPHFALRYKRNSRVGTFEDGCFDYIQYVAEHGEKDLPDYFESSHDISWEDHLKMQAVFAEFIDSSVSKTINLPNNASIADVKKAYELAYELGIKSTTVYRDGSKTQVLETLDSRKLAEARPKKIIRRGAPKRPEILPCDIHRTIVKGTPWIVMVGMLDGEPYEVFAGKQDKVELEDKIVKGELVKVSSGKYLLKANGTKINVKTVFENAEQAAMTRMISTNLRHGTDIVFIVEQLDKAEDSIVDFSKAVGRVLKKYIKEGQKLTRKCPNCSSPSIENVWEAGCEKVICKACGLETSKCF